VHWLRIALRTGARCAVYRDNDTPTPTHLNLPAIFGYD
jgi:hypothetical protein